MRGVFERSAGSGVWWIVYYVDGKRRREKVGAAKLRQVRKVSGTIGKKLPELRKTGRTTIADLADLVLTYTASHKDVRGYITKAKLIKAGLGGHDAASVTPAVIEQWLSSHCRSAATYNRYKAFLSLSYRLGIRESKVFSKPGRDAIHRKEPDGRERYLSREEHYKLRGVIARKHPEHLAEFVVSVHTGMRLGEQYLCRWS